MEDDSWSIAALRDVNSLTDRIIPSHVRISAAGESHRAAVPGRARHLPGARSLRTRSNKLILMVSAERLTYISFTHLRSSLVKSSTADRHHSNLNGTVFGMHYWSECLRGQAATYRKFAEQADDNVVKRNLLELTSGCEEVANNHRRSSARRVRPSAA
jgi:hypothetical protein